tara:strand:+ start:25393 stop:25779 length:387 start_codon:yes stop_codon:yes gene_type:complete
METSEKRALTTTANIIGLIIMTTPRNIRCKHIALLLNIAQHPGLTLSELHDGLPRYSLGAIAKLIHELTHESWRKDDKDHEGIRRLPGFGLVRLQADPRDHRIKRVYLSDKGKKLIDDLIHLHLENSL